MRSTGRVVAAALLVATMALPAMGQESGHIEMIQALPGENVDVVIAGTPLFEGFEFGQRQDLSSLAGATLTALEVRQTGSGTVLVEIDALTVPATGSHTVVVHMNETGEPTLSTFANDISTISAGLGRLVFRHAAAAPAADVLVNGSPTFMNISNPNEVSADLPSGMITVAASASESDELVLEPLELSLDDGSVLIVYLVGSEADETVQILNETLTGMGTTPDVVDTGSSPVGIPGLVWASAVLTLVTGGLVWRMRVGRR